MREQPHRAPGPCPLFGAVEVMTGLAGGGTLTGTAGRKIYDRDRAIDWPAAISRFYELLGAIYHEDETRPHARKTEE